MAGGGETLLIRNDLLKAPSDWSRDMRHMTYTQLEGDATYGIWYLEETAEAERVLRANLSSADQRIQHAVCPLYGVNDRGKPYLIGSSLLLKVGDRRFLVSAAHVLDWNKKRHFTQQDGQSQY